MSEPDLSRLGAYFPPEDLEWKPITFTKDKAKALAAAYVDNRAIMDRLDAVVGPENWRNEFRPGPEGGVLCGLSIRVGGEWVTKWDGAENTDIEPIKGGLSGAMRRAAVQWQIGRYLYKLPSVWVPVDERGRFTQPPRVPPEFLPRDEPEPRERPAPVMPAMSAEEYEAEIEALRREVLEAVDATGADEARKMLVRAKRKWEPVVSAWPESVQERAFRAWDEAQAEVKAAWVPAPAPEG